MWKYQNRVIKVGRGWTDNEGVKHPSNWNNWDADTKAAKGLVWEDDAPSFDNRFYWSHEVPKAIDDVDAVDEDGNPVLDEKGEQVITRGLKWNAIQVAKQQAAGKLALSDWKVVKAAEVADYSVDQETLTYRAAVRAASNTIETAINAAADLDAFIALYNVPVDKDGNPIGNAPINDWPQEI